MNVIPALGKLGQEDSKFKAGLSYTASLRLAWTTQQDLSQKEKKPGMAREQ